MIKKMNVVTIIVENSIRPKKYSKYLTSRNVGEVAEQIRDEHGMNDGEITIDDISLDLNKTFEKQNVNHGAELHFINGKKIFLIIKLNY